MIGILGFGVLRVSGFSVKGFRGFVGFLFFGVLGKGFVGFESFRVFVRLSGVEG